MPVDLTKSPMLLQLLNDIISHISRLSQQDNTLHRLIHTLQQYAHHPTAVNGDHLKLTLNSLKDVVSSYTDYDKNLPNMFWHAITEIDHLTMSQKLMNMPIKSSLSGLLLNIERLRKHGIRK
jgi:hypothetical protein